MEPDAARGALAEALVDRGFWARLVFWLFMELCFGCFPCLHRLLLSFGCREADVRCD